MHFSPTLAARSPALPLVLCAARGSGFGGGGRRLFKALGAPARPVRACPRQGQGCRAIPGWRPESGPAGLWVAEGGRLKRGCWLGEVGGRPRGSPRAPSFHPRKDPKFAPAPGGPTCPSWLPQWKSKILGASRGARAPLGQPPPPADGETEAWKQRTVGPRSHDGGRRTRRG